MRSKLKFNVSVTPSIDPVRWDFSTAEFTSGMPATERSSVHSSPLFSAAAFALLALSLETLFSIPYRTVYLVTHSAPKSWLVALITLAISTVGYLRRHLLSKAARSLLQGLSPVWMSGALTLAAGFALRMLWVLRFHPPLASDGAGYFTEATHLAQQHFYDGTFWPPGFPLFLTPFLTLLGAHYYVAVLCGFLLFAAQTILTRVVSFQVTGSRRAAAFGGWIVAMWPGQIAVVGINSKEALIACLLVAISGLLYGTGHWTGQRLWAGLVLAGVLAGFAALSQPGLLLFPSVFLLAQWLLTRRLLNALLRTAVASFAMISAIFPWTIRNYVNYGRVIAISSNGGSVFYRANNPHANASYSSEGEVALPKDTIAADREGYALAREWITHHPVAFTVLAVRKQVVFLGDDGDGVYEGLKRNQSPSTLLYAGLKGITSLYWFLLWFCLVCSCKRLFREPRWTVWFAVAFLPYAYQWALDSIFESGSRHHLAHVGCLAVLCAAAFSGWVRDEGSQVMTSPTIAEDRLAG